MRSSPTIRINSVRHVKSFGPGIEGTFVNHAREDHGGREVATRHLRDSGVWGTGGTRGGSGHGDRIRLGDWRGVGVALPR